MIKHTHIVTNNEKWKSIKQGDSIQLDLEEKN